MSTNPKFKVGDFVYIENDYTSDLNKLIQWEDFEFFSSRDYPKKLHLVFMFSVKQVLMPSNNDEIKYKLAREYVIPAFNKDFKFNTAYIGFKKLYQFIKEMDKDFYDRRADFSPIIIDTIKESELTRYMGNPIML